MLKSCETIVKGEVYNMPSKASTVFSMPDQCEMTFEPATLPPEDPRGETGCRPAAKLWLTAR